VWPAVLGCIFHDPLWTLTTIGRAVNPVGVCQRLMFKCIVCLAAFTAGLVHIGHPHACAKPGKARF
jgi:hypothetical protein